MQFGDSRSLAMIVTIPDMEESALSARLKTIRSSKQVDQYAKISMRKIAHEIGINRELLQLMAIKELRLKPYKFQKIQLPTDENKRMQLQRCRQLKCWAAGQQWESILFTHKKLFSIQQAHNHQNDRNWSAEAPGCSVIIKHRQNPMSVMVWDGICARGKTPLVFVDQGAKINQDVYCRDVLEAVILP
ncbi:uncharacterized protein LOC111630602 [Centruroides sculpturatus]|uniref:uncharacterized protein LOC111630602 n=1 Tax=Centruroides sculpturatus TaxID=218467 RepID=UPI000C6D9FE2|nr:uncharacterized protein LOC111630602 [Centruroides sculpturatus]